MGCGGPKQTPEEQLVQIQLMAAQQAERKAKREKKRVVRHDFHCVDCGHVGPHKDHVCAGKKELAYQHNRMQFCSGCQYNRDDVCVLYKQKHPDRDCLISVGIQMPHAQCPAGLWPRVQLNCPKCGSITFDDRGVDKCSVCNRVEAKVCTMPFVVNEIKEDPWTPLHSKLVVSLAVGQNALDVLELTRPQMEKYAARVGADFRVIQGDRFPRYPLANKFRLRQLAANYDRVLFVDADVWIRDDADNLFDVVPEGTVGMHADITNMKSAAHIKRAAERVAAEQQVDPIVFRGYNSGVVVFDRAHLDMWAAPLLPFKPGHLSEQTWVEYNLHRMAPPMTWLDDRYNCQWWFKDFKEQEPSAHFVHLADCPHEERIYRFRKYRFAQRSASATDRVD